MVDAKYRKVYQEKVKYRVMFSDKWILAEKHDTSQEAFASVSANEDFLIVETFPGFQKIPAYCDNVK